MRLMTARPAAQRRPSAALGSTARERAAPHTPRVHRTGRVRAERQRGAPRQPQPLSSPSRRASRPASPPERRRRSREGGERRPPRPRRPCPPCPGCCGRGALPDRWGRGERGALGPGRCLRGGGRAPPPWPRWRRLTGARAGRAVKARAGPDSDPPRGKRGAEPRAAPT